MSRLRPVTAELPSEIGVHQGLAYTLWLPGNRSEPTVGGVVVLHGAGSCKENHHDFARVVLAAGLAAIAFDQRGHGESEGSMGAGVLDDIAAMTTLLRERIGDATAPMALRGSSMGGYLALMSAPVVDAAVVVAVCPARGESLRKGLADGRFDFRADAPGLESFLGGHDLDATVAAIEAPVLLLHAEGDERVPVEHSRELAALLRSPRSRLITLSGGHHRSIQHDPELQAFSLRFIQRALAPR